MERREPIRHLGALCFVILALGMTSCTSPRAGFGHIQERSIQLDLEDESGALSLQTSINKRFEEIDLDAVAAEALGPMPEGKVSSVSKQSLSPEEMVFDWVAFDLPETVMAELMWHDALTDLPLDLETGKTLEAKVAARAILSPNKQDPEQKPGLLLLQTMIYGVHAHPRVRWIPPFIDRVHQALLNRMEALLIEEARKRGLQK